MCLSTHTVGDVVGAGVGLLDGNEVDGDAVGWAVVGEMLGLTLGNMVGIAEGSDVGIALGINELDTGSLM